MTAVSLTGASLQVLEYRFVAQAAELGGWPMPPGVEPDFSPPIGQRFQFGISEHWPIWYVRDVLSSRPAHGRPLGGTLPEFIARVRAAIKTVERRDVKRGTPAARYAAATRRDGRWFFLVESGRVGEDEVAKRYHDSGGEQHEADNPWPWCVCPREVKRQLARDRGLIAKAVSTPADCRTRLTDANPPTTPGFASVTSQSFAVACSP